MWLICGYLSYLGATPDGIIDEYGIVEIKCPSSCQQLSPEEAIISRTFNFWTLRNKLIFPINNKHKYYFQVHSQLHLAKRNYCFFVLWTPKCVKTENIIKPKKRLLSNQIILKLVDQGFEAI